MALGMMDRLREFVDGNKSVRRVADDIELTCELVLLVRMMFADGELKAQEMENFTRLCATAFGIPEDDVPKVLKYLKDFGYETNSKQAASMFTDLPVERKRSLLVHMLSIAKADDDLHEHEVELIRNTANILGLTADDIRKAREV
ncbi:MAG: TerB family tellurite resistance protein [Rhizobiaceae bacterium]